MNFKIPKIRSEKHRRFVANKACMLSGLMDGVQAHHLLRAEGKGMATKASDIWLVPLHHTLHDALHKNGNEVVFFENHGMDYEYVMDTARICSELSPDKKIREAIRLWVSLRRHC